MDDKWFRWRTRRKTPASAVEVTAQALYDALVKDTLSPALRALGFKGSGGRYSMPCSDCWALLGLQKSAYSDAADVQFTINLLVANKSAWGAARQERHQLPERPTATTLYGEPASQMRIGELTPEGADKWWRVHSRAHTAAVGNDVVHDIREYALPWLRHQIQERRCGAEEPPN
jgi:hypothetical protein